MDGLLVSTGTAVTLLVGLVISVFYLRYAGIALRNAARTIDQPDDTGADAFAYSFAGAVVAVVLSSLAIVAYGFGPGFLYIGVVLALLSPVAVVYTLWRETQD